MSNPNANSPEKRAFEQVTNRFLQLPLEYRSLPYHTTLKNPGTPQTFNVTQNINKEIMPIALMPIKQDGNVNKIKEAFPFGIYFFNKERNNHLMISNHNILSFSGITENFQICPMKFLTRRNIHEAVNEMIWETYQIVTQEKGIPGIDTQKMIESKKEGLPFLLQSIGNKNRQITDKKTQKVAWMELNAFNSKLKVKNRRYQQQLLIQFILNSNLDSLWITINPNMYYSKIAKLKENKKNLFKTLSLFTKKLTQKAARLKKKTPSILIGFEITNNFYKPNLPSEFAQDIYGNKYHDIPRPLDKTFWENEITIPLTMFLKEWNNKKISHGVKISGIILDLEMYCRKTTGTFLSTMGFEPKTIAGFLKPTLSKVISPSRFSQYLIDNKLASKYFKHLENQALTLGKSLRDYFYKEIPDGIIGCYAPNISINWFYK
ncbi:hypothetical protein KAU11_06225, partial [Candidatus Babeliales bacterium]|nr:hypothetical protein [Candidatus Babeliales bacterium]